MILESSISYLEILKPYLPYLIITFLVWITYFYTLRCAWVSDDIAGIAEYDGKLQGMEYGMLWRWVRYHICGGNTPSKHKIKQPDGKEIVITQGHIPARHHFLSIVIFNITCLITYVALKPIIGDKTALMAILILIVHPCTTQGVAWISGLAYPLSLFWISLTVILMRWFYASPDMNHAMIVIPLFVVIQFFAIHAIFATTALVCFLLLFLGYWQFAILGFFVSGAMCFDQIRKTVVLRVEEFKKQHMGQSTVFHWRKGIVAMKTFWYYIVHAIFPACMGLYHEWGFHYDSDMEIADEKFWSGFASLIALTCIFFISDCVPAKLGILWFIIFSIGFWNFITAQQFVTERYIMVAVLGLGMLIAILPIPIYMFILGAYLVRTWLYLPTYDNELRFYQSNTWQFPKSEVAMGNLGVTYARAGLEDTARDTWAVAASINPDYDVPWVNIFYQYRSKGFVMINNGNYVEGLKKLQEGLPFLEKALNCKVCHFPEQWKKEYLELANSIRNPATILQDELMRLLKLKESLRNELAKASDSKRVNEIMESVNNNERQMSGLVAFFKSSGLQPTNHQAFNAYHTTSLLDNIRR